MTIWDELAELDMTASAETSAARRAEIDSELQKTERIAQSLLSYRNRLMEERSRLDAGEFPVPTPSLFNRRNKSVLKAVYVNRLTIGQVVKGALIVFLTFIVAAVVFNAVTLLFTNVLTFVGGWAPWLGFAAAIVVILAGISFLLPKRENHNT